MTHAEHYAAMLDALHEKDIATAEQHLIAMRAIRAANRS